ncbi:hypothetical protein [Thioalkalivibrio sp. ALgr3]|uniref:hypothetical protein n=1 Tax=Thioalkalivibrio sp. ALgr3 TaxID=1239292 RepID=UPI000375432F|nr:hypothetical protein [Thioalkalivibrio sp. ALgr3]
MLNARHHRNALTGLTVLACATPALAAAQAQDDSGSDWGMDISLILEGVYYNEMSEGVHEPAGFDDGHDHGHGHDHDHDHSFDDGFNLGHNELVFEADLGGLLDGTLMIGFDDSDIEVEEAYLTTRSLPAGLQLKAGKFLSDIGYINSRHVHDWDFVDRPLVNEYLFGDHGLQEIGVQGTWVAPTETYTQLGVELLQGDNSFIPYEGSGGSHTDGDDTIHSSFSDVSGPRMVTAFAKVGPDLGPDHAAQFGVSGGYANTWQQETEHGSGLEEWDGDAWFAGLDAVYKYSSGRAYGHGDWRVQGEYFYREVDLDYQRRQFDTTHERHGIEGSGKSRQDGLYVQGVYGFAPRWEAGLRTEALGLTNDGRIERDDLDTAIPSFDTSYRHSAQVTFRPVEPVFLRAQLTQNDFVDDHGDRDRGLEFMFQVNVALGAHGAHRF